MKVTLYKFENKQIIVDKTNYLLSPYQIDGEVPEVNQNMETPILYFKFTAEPDYNYVYIQDYNRYYYVSDKTWMGGNVWKFSLSVDELYTYRALVKSLSGIVKYSTLGENLRIDPRLTLMFPQRTTIAPVANTDLTGGVPYVCMRYYTSEFDSTLIGSTSPPLLIKVTYMTFTAFQGFLINYMALFNNSSTESMAMAVAASIIDISVVWYCVPTNGTMPVASDTDIVFDSPGVMHANNYQTITISASHPQNSAQSKAYTVYPYNNVLTSGITYEFNLGSGNFWDRYAKRKLYLPYLGAIDIDADAMGLNFIANINIKYEVRHEPLENVYVVTPIVGNTRYYNNRVIANVNTTLPFPVDASFQNKDMVEQLKVFNLIAQGVGLAAGTAATGGMMFPAAVGGIIGGATGMMQEYAALENADAMSYQFKGVIGGSPDILSPSPTVYVEVITIPAASNYMSFWADHGKPDGAFRSLATMSGYVQMEDFEMIYDSNATKDEMQRLEAQLYKGVIL